jgi:hypothetical protein
VRVMSARVIIYEYRYTRTRMRVQIRYLMIVIGSSPRRTDSQSNESSCMHVLVSHMRAMHHFANSKGLFALVE